MVENALFPHLDSFTEDRQTSSLNIPSEVTSTSSLSRPSTTMHPIASPTLSVPNSNLHRSKPRSLPPLIRRTVVPELQHLMSLSLCMSLSLYPQPSNSQRQPFELYTIQKTPCSASINASCIHPSPRSKPPRLLRSYRSMLT